MEKDDGTNTHSDCYSIVVCALNLSKFVCVRPELALIVSLWLWLWLWHWFWFWFWRGDRSPKVD